MIVGTAKLRNVLGSLTSAPQLINAVAAKIIPETSNVLFAIWSKLCPRSMGDEEYLPAKYDKLTQVAIAVTIEPLIAGSVL